MQFAKERTQPPQQPTAAPHAEPQLSHDFSHDTFADAVQQNRPQVIDFTIDEQAAVRLKEVLESGGTLLVGELHGAAENASIIYSLMRTLNIRNLGLEWAHSMEPALETFRATGVLPAGLEQETDGRMTAEHFAMLAQTHHEGALDKLTLFGGALPNKTHDHAMAERIIAASLDSDSADPMLAVMGSWHSRIGGSPPSAADHLMSRQSPLLVAKIVYHCGAVEAYELSTDGRMIPTRYELPGSPPQAPRIYMDGETLCIDLGSMPIHPAVRPGPFQVEQTRVLGRPGV